MNVYQQRLETLETPFVSDVVLHRGDGEALSNVPRSVIFHSPDGFEWGYNGSGPADLALNIINAFVPPGWDKLDPVKCYKGEVSFTAFILHQEFKREFIEVLPKDGGIIKRFIILDWIKARKVSEKPF